MHIRNLLLSGLALTGQDRAKEKPDVRATLADGSTVIGLERAGINTYLGIPFAQPPVGPLRFKPPQPLTEPLGTFDATNSPHSCPQFAFNEQANSTLEKTIARLINFPALNERTLNASEDCLTLNVFTPPNAKHGDNLPVVFWIYGGAFSLGWSTLFNGSTFVNSSIEQNKPIVWVAVNYRVGAYGLMPGKEILAEGSTNVGLRDQRLALQWVADNIALFGGDPDKVTLMGESAGSISTSLQMSLYGGNNTYKGKPLFRGAIMSSGSNIPYAEYDSPQAQEVFDRVVNNAGCQGQGDPLECLRALPYDKFQTAASGVAGLFDYNGVQLSYAPRADGDTIPEPVDVLSQQGRYAKVPFILSDQEDEGTLFAQSSSNISTTDQLVTWFNQYFFPQADRSVVQAFVDTYPDDPTQGSPYRTGDDNDAYPQYKRLAAALGDILFTLQRRRTLHYNVVNGGCPTWSYIATYFHGTPRLGTFHASDIIHGFGYLGDTDVKKVQHAYLLSFINTLDPNNGTSSEYSYWPQWTEEGGEILSLTNDLESSVSRDDFREDSYNYILENISKMRT